MARDNAEREKRILATMKYCQCSYEEALSMIQEDEAIDRGERLDWEPTVEEEREMRKNNKVTADRKPRATGGKRERQPDLVKREVIDIIFNAIKDKYDNVTVSNIEKVIDFAIGDDTFSIDLKKHRKKKETN